MANNFDMFTKKGPSNTSENLPYAFSHISSGAPPSVYMSMVTGNTFDEAMQETNNIPMSPDEMDMDLDLDLDPELDDPDALEKAIYQLRIAEEKEIEPEEVLETPYGPGLSAEEIDLLLDMYPALDAGVDLDMIDENFDEVDRMLGKSGENIEAAMDAAEQRAQDEGEIGSSPAMMRQLGDNLGSSLEAMLNPRNRGEEMAAELFSNSPTDPYEVLRAASDESVRVFQETDNNRSAKFKIGQALGPSNLMGTLGDTDQDDILGSDFDIASKASEKRYLEENQKQRGLRLQQAMEDSYYNASKRWGLTQGGGGWDKILKIIHGPTKEGGFFTPEEVVEELIRVGKDGEEGAEYVKEFLAARFVDPDGNPLTDANSADAGIWKIQFNLDVMQGYEGGTISELREALELFVKQEEKGIAKIAREKMKPEPIPGIDIPPTAGEEASRLERKFEETYSEDEQIDIFMKQNPDFIGTPTEALEKSKKERAIFKESSIQKQVENQVRAAQNIPANEPLTEEQQEIVDSETAARMLETEEEAITEKRKGERDDGSTLFDLGTEEPEDPTAPPKDISTSDLVEENLMKIFYTTVYAYPEAGRSDVRDRLPYIFNDTRTLYFLEHGVNAYATRTILEQIKKVEKAEPGEPDTELLRKELLKQLPGDTLDEVRTSLLGSMETRYKSFLAEYLTDPSSKRTGEAFRKNLALISDTLSYAANNPDRDSWPEGMEEREVWVEAFFGATGGVFADKNRRNLIKMAATQGGSGYYSSLIHRSVDRVFDYYKRIGWTLEEIFTKMAQLTGMPVTGPDDKHPVVEKSNEVTMTEDMKDIMAEQGYMGGEPPPPVEQDRYSGITQAVEKAREQVLPGVFPFEGAPRPTPDPKPGVEVDMDPRAEDWAFEADPGAIADALAARGLSITGEPLPVPERYRAELAFDPMDPRRDYTFSADPVSVEEASIDGMLMQPEYDPAYDVLRQGGFVGEELTPERFQQAVDYGRLGLQFSGAGGVLSPEEWATIRPTRDRPGPGEPDDFAAFRDANGRSPWMNLRL